LDSTSVSPGVIGVTVIDPRTMVVKPEPKFQPPALAFIPASESACPSQDVSCLSLSIVPNAEVSLEIHSAASLE